MENLLKNKILKVEYQVLLIMISHQRNLRSLFRVLLKIITQGSPQIQIVNQDNLAKINL